MTRLGWTSREGAPDVGRLAQAVGCRWQTAQFWIDGKAVPGTRYAKRVAEALGMTLEELVGLALQREPRTPGWSAFLETDLGKSMTDEERKILSMLPAPAGRRYESWVYQTMLAAIRNGTEPGDR